MTSYYAYVWAELGPLYALFIIFYAIYMLYAMYVFYGYFVNHDTRIRKSERSIVKFVLHNMLEEREGTLYIHNRIVSSSIVKLLVIYVFNITAMALAVGWDIFLLEKTYACDPKLDCFISENREQIQNCSAVYDPVNNNRSEAIGNNSNNTNDGSDPNIICFRFASNYVLAASAIGGLFTFGGGVMSLLAFGNIWIHDRAVAKCSHACAAFIMVALQLFSSLLFIALFYVTIFVKELANAALKDPHSTVQFVSLVVTVFFALMVPWYRLKERSNVQEPNQQHVNEDGETEGLVDPTNTTKVYH